MSNETWSGPKRLRTSDTEREQVAEILRAAMSEGRLNLEEGEERLTAAYAASYRDELAPLTADLPDGGRRALLNTPEARDAARRGLRRHGLIVVSIAMILTGLWIVSGAHFFWPIIPLFFLSMGFLRHARWRRYEPRFAPWNAPHAAHGPHGYRHW
jgi:hypothetical protein